MSNFFTVVVQKSAHFELPGRVADTNLLEPVTRDAVQAIMAEAKTQGFELMVWETFRSRARQLDLFNQGATKLREVGVHNYGLACDLVKSVRGEPSWKGPFTLLGSLARQHGLIWGGDWGEPNQKHSFVDAFHVQRCPLSRQAALFRGDWYPDAAYDPYQDVVRGMIG